MVTWTDQLAGPLGLSPGTLHVLQLCLEEAVINILNFAFEPDTAHDMHVAIWRSDSTLNAEVTDDGRPFDPVAYELPDLPRDLQSARIGGHGIRLMRRFTDRIAYQRSGELNRLLLSFSVGAPPVKRPVPKQVPKEIGGPQGPEPTRYGDWEVNGRCSDF
jgi:anti-sigma regulatory factor (Ser/Thr protein kinase)